jgi:hypothetical protein
LGAGHPTREDDAHFGGNDQDFPVDSLIKIAEPTKR